MGATKKDRRINAVLSVLLTILCIAWMYPVFMILMNSLKTERAITTTHAFELPNAETFVGLKNYIYGIQEMDFLSSFWYSLVITVSSVALILLCCSMCAWYITRVQGVLGKGMYYLCVFSMIVPFQMVMFTLAKTADTLKLNNPYNICIIYLGFGAGLAVFMFTGFVKSMPIAIEEAAMIDGCSNTKMFLRIVMPLAMPMIAVIMLYYLVTHWNVYFRALLYISDPDKYPLQLYLRNILLFDQMLDMMEGDAEALEAMTRRLQLRASIKYGIVVVSSLPVLILYPLLQKYFAKGVMVGAVKG